MIDAGRQPKTQKRKRPEEASGYVARYNALMAKINADVTTALEAGRAVQCPICDVIHPGIRYAHTDHRRFCSTPCFREGIRKEREEVTRG